MLAHVDPSRATRSEKWEKKGRAKYPVKRRIFWPYRVVGGRGGGPSLLRRGENCRTAMPRPGGPWPDLRAAAPAADPGKKKRGSQCNPQSSQVRWMDVCPRLLDLCFCCSPSLLSVRIETLHLRPVRCSFICQYSATPKHHGSVGRTRHEIAPKKCLTSLLKSY